MDAPSYIRNHEAVVASFGYWPSFHDAPVVAYEFEPGAETITLTLHTFLMTNEVDAKGYFVLRNHALVSFRFDGVHDADMDAFGTENTLDGLDISQGPSPASFRVQLDSVIDKPGVFSARSGEVTAVTPCTSEGTAA